MVIFRHLILQVAFHIKYLTYWTYIQVASQKQKHRNSKVVEGPVFLSFDY